MNGILRVLLLSSLMFHGEHVSTPIVSSSAGLKPPDNDKELSCYVSLPSEIRSVEGYFDANLVITNTSDHLVRICTLTQGWRSVRKAHYVEIVRPDLWKSDRPGPEEFPKKIVNIAPGKSVSIPLKIRYCDQFVRGKPLTISAGYETGAAFARMYGTWSGSIRSKPVTVTVTE